MADERRDLKRLKKRWGRMRLSGWTGKDMRMNEVWSNIM